MKELRVRFYPEQDEKLFIWLEELNKLPFGEKSKTVKETLLRGLNLDSRMGSTAALNQGAHNGTGELLSDIRRVMEATLESAISRLSITPLAAVPQTKQDETDVIDAILDNFGANLMMLDEEEEDF